MGNIPVRARISLIRGSSTWSLTDGTYCRCFGIQNAGAMAVGRLTDRGPLQHGHTDRGFRAQSRRLRLLLYFSMGDEDDFWDRRETLIEMLEPTNTQAQLRFLLGTTPKRRQIDCHPLGFPMDTDPAQARHQRIAVDFDCPYPAFYDPTGETLIYGIGYAGKSFQIPMDIPLGIGQSTIDETVTLTYSGSWRSYPYRIRIVGPITDCVITNESTGEKLDFTGASIGASDYYDIDLRYSYKTVVDSSNVNQIADLTSDSDLTSWHLATAREVANGQNTISVTGTGATSETEVYIQYYTYYAGI